MLSKNKIVIGMLSTLPMMGFAASDDNDTQPVKTMVISATLEPKNIEDVPAFSTVLTKEDINKSSVSSVADLLRETTGVNNYTDGNGRDSIQIRGLGGEYTVLLVNGKRVDSEGAFDKGSDADLNSIPMGAIERIEIIRGPMSVLYGADAIGGVINIITKTPQEGDAWTGSVKTDLRILESGKGGDQHRSSITARGPISDQAYLSFSAENLNREAWFEDENAITPIQEEKNTQNFLSTLVWDMTDKQSIELDLGYNHDKRPYQIYSYNTYNGTISYRKQEITSYDFALTHKGDWGWADTTLFIKREMSDVYDYSSLYDAPQAHEGLEANNNYAKFYAHSNIGMHTLLTGIDYTGQEIKNSYSYSGGGSYNSDEYALFAQDEIALMDDITLTLGARVDEHETYGTNFSPKAYLVYSATDTITIKGGVSQAFKAPTAEQLSPDFVSISCGGGCYQSGNPDLAAETSISYELGFDYINTDFTVSASIFRNDIDNLIDRKIGRDSFGVANSVEWVNLKTTMTQGVEFSTSVDLSAALMMKANYTFLDTETKDADGEKTVLEGRAKHQINTSMDYQINSMINTYLSLNYINGMEVNDHVLAPYSRADIGVNANISDDFIVRAGVKNIGDILLSEEDALYSTRELGRSYFMSLEYRFGG